MTCPRCQHTLVENAVYCNDCGATIGCPAPPVRYAGFWRRVAAVVLDLAIMWPAIVLSVVGLTDLARPGENGKMWFEALVVPSPNPYADMLHLVTSFSALAVATFLALAPYYIFAEISPLQATLGKRILRMRVVDADGNRIRMRSAIIRFLARILSHAPFMLGFLMPAFTSKKQALHDIVAGTYITVAPRGNEAGRCGGCGMRIADNAAFCHRCGRRLPGPRDLTPYAGFSRRMLAVAIDVAFLALPLLIVSGAFVRQPSAEQQQVMAESRADFRIRPAHREAFAAYWRWFFSQFAVTFFVFSLYNTVAEASPLQGTFGKRVVGLRVVDLQGRRIGLRLASGRCAARLLSALSWHIGFLMAAFTRRNQTLHDIVTGSMVVRNSPNPAEDPAKPRPTLAPL